MVDAPGENRYIYYEYAAIRRENMIQEEDKMEKLLEILNEIDDGVDYANETRLIDDHILDSFGVITLVSELEDAFDISIDAAEMVPANFNSADSIWNMVKRLQEN